MDSEQGTRSTNRSSPYAESFSRSCVLGVPRVSYSASGPESTQHACQGNGPSHRPQCLLGQAQPWSRETMIADSENWEKAKKRNKNKKEKLGFIGGKRRFVSTTRQPGSVPYRAHEDVAQLRSRAALGTPRRLGLLGGARRRGVGRDQSRSRGRTRYSGSRRPDRKLAGGRAARWVSAGQGWASSSEDGDRLSLARPRATAAAWATHLVAVNVEGARFHSGSETRGGGGQQSQARQLPIIRLPSSSRCPSVVAQG